MFVFFPKFFLLTAIVVTIFLCSSKEMFGEPPTYLVSRYTLIFCLINIYFCVYVYLCFREFFFLVLFRFVSFCFIFCICSKLFHYFHVGRVVLFYTFLLILFVALLFCLLILLIFCTLYVVYTSRVWLGFGKTLLVGERVPPRVRKATVACRLPGETGYQVRTQEDRVVASGSRLEVECPCELACSRS